MTVVLAVFNVALFFGLSFVVTWVGVTLLDMLPPVHRWIERRLQKRWREKGWHPATECTP